jgi:hypothetical protein
MISAEELHTPRIEKLRNAAVEVEQEARWEVVLQTR